MTEKKLRWFSYGVIAFVAVVAVAGVVLVGFPNDERARRFDERRVSDLQQIQSQIVEYWQRSGRLPTALSELAPLGAQYFIPTDPETGESYRYEPAKPGTRVNASTTYFLCATFALEYYAADNRAGAPRSPSFSTQRFREEWDHAAGSDCFERVIDPLQYPAVKPPVATGGCVITGCSGQVCAESELATTCEFRPEYACYKQYSRCERRTDGRCGWAETPELSRCMQAPAGEKPVPQ